MYADECQQFRDAVFFGGAEAYDYLSVHGDSTLRLLWQPAWNDAGCRDTSHFRLHTSYFINGTMAQISTQQIHNYAQRLSLHTEIDSG